MSSLVRAILDQRVDQVRRLAESEPALLEKRSPSGSLPLDLARKAGHVDSEVVLLRHNAPGTQRPAKVLLLEYLHHISNDYFAAVWLSGIGRTLWQLVQRQPVAPGEPLALLPDEVLDDLSYLAEQAGGWWGRLDGEARFFATREWEQELEKQSPKTHS